jgi:peroxiredoxin
MSAGQSPRPDADVVSRRRRSAIFIVFYFGLAWCVSTSAQPATLSPLPDIQTLGPQVGSTVPTFTLKDQTGAMRTLESLQGERGMVLVFYRSADWCPYCKTQLVELQGRLDQLRRAGLGLAAISYDPVAVLADFARRRDITYPLLSDAGSALITRLGLLNTTVPESNRQQRGIPFPGTLVVDRRGVVTSRFFEAAYQERITINSVLVKLGNRVNAVASTVTGSYLEATTYASDETVAPGTRFSIVVDVSPRRNVHVYAPGEKSYQPIALTFEPQPGVIVGSTNYPKSDEFFFAPLKERVRVYQDAFQIVQDLTIDPSPQAAIALSGAPTLTIKGRLEYQACDDRVCYLPQSIPLAWTVALKPLDRERAQPLK